MTNRRVAITGIGAITPIGTGRDALWAGIRAERSAVRSISRFDPSIFRSHNAAEVNDFAAADHIESKRAKRLDRFGQFSVAAAKMAIADSGIRLEVENRERIGVHYPSDSSASRQLAGGIWHKIFGAKTIAVPTLSRVLDRARGEW